MSLATYKKKRDFNQTAEPLPKIGKERGARTFVIQRHNASRLHYDLRLEVNGVLKSWAVPKGPSLNPTDKRLAMMVEDHPLSYGTFKGVIPEGNYGAGIVEIWDKGTYDPEEMEKVSDKAIEKNINNGMLKFSLKGKKLKGSFALVRIKGEDSKNWLLIKHRDKFATEDPYNSEDDTPVNSPINKQLRNKDASGSKASQKSPAKAITKRKDRREPALKSASVKKSVGTKKSATVKAIKDSTVKQKTASVNESVDNKTSALVAKTADANGSLVGTKAKSTATKSKQSVASAKSRRNISSNPTSESKLPVKKK